MQVEASSASYQRSAYSASPQLAAASPPANLHAYSFPPPPKTAPGDEQQHRSGTASTTASATGEFRSGHNEGNFSFTAPPPSQHPAGASPRTDDQNRHEGGGEHRTMPEGYAQPRSMSLAGLVDFDSAPVGRVSSPAMTAGMTAQAHPSQQQQHQQQQHEYSTLATSVSTGGPIPQRVVSAVHFAEYMPEHPHFAPPTHHVHQQAHHFVPAHFAPPVRAVAHPFFQYRPYSFGTATAPAAPRPRTTYTTGPPGPPLEWAKPRSGSDEGEAGAAAYARMFAPAPPGPARMAQHGHAVYYSSYAPGGLMIRSTSNQSGLSSFSESTESSHPSNAGNASDYEGHHVNPAFVNTSGDSGYYSSPQMDHTSGFARSTSSTELGAVAGLRLDGSPVAGSSGTSSRFADAESEQTIRGLRLNGASKETLRAVTGHHGEASTPSSGGKSKRRVASTIFHPPPQAMLAPGAYSPSGSAIGARRGKPYATTQHTAILPTDDEFAALPTKRSRGRCPPVKSELAVDEADPNGEPTEAQIAWAGTTKTGKPKKIFLCKVPGCGKCFKRSEHLKRHVRSIHTNEKPFQCQWPTCKRLFSRHDNLNQHLRIHREPGMTDAEFSAALQDCFGQRLEEVQRERAWAPLDVAASAAAVLGGAGAGEGSAEGDGEYITEEDDYAPRSRSRSRTTTAGTEDDELEFEHHDDDDDDERDGDFAPSHQQLYATRAAARRARSDC